MPIRRLVDKYAPLIHAVVVGLSAAGLYLSEHNATLATAGTIVISRALGWLLKRPKIVHGTKLDSPLTRQGLERVRREVRDEAHQLRNRLTAWQGEVELAIDDAIRKLEGVAEDIRRNNEQGRST